MKTKAQIQHRMREIEKELTKDYADGYSADTKTYWKDYHMNLGRIKALNWVLSRD